MQAVQIGNNQAGQRLDKFLHKLLPGAGSNFLYKMLRKKNITLNGKKAEGSEILSAGDEICVFFSSETFAKFSGRNSESIGQPGKQAYMSAYQNLQGVKILYEDDDCLILDKPAGMLTQKASAGDCSLNEWMIGYLLTHYPALKQELPTFRPSVCNRLDRNTSGIVLCGKSLAGLQYLSECIRNRSVRKFYRTICMGELRETVKAEGYLVKDNSKNRVKITQNPMASDVEPHSNAKTTQIRTVYTPIAVIKGYTLLEAELITGKPHQIRGQLAAMGYPLIGDYKYGRDAVNRFFRQKYGLGSQLLHAYRVEFMDTAVWGEKRMLAGRSFHTPCPELFVRLQKELGFRAEG